MHGCESSPQPEVATDMQLTSIIPKILQPAPTGAGSASGGTAAVAPPIASTAPAAAPVAPEADASFAARMLSSIGMTQNRYVANQQMLGAISDMFTTRIAQVGANLLTTLRGLREESPDSVS